MNPYPLWKPNAEALDGKFRDLHRGVVGLGDDTRHLVPGAWSRRARAVRRLMVVNYG